MDEFRKALTEGLIEFEPDSIVPLSDGCTEFHSDRVPWAEIPKVDGIPLIGSNGDGPDISPLAVAWDGESMREILTHEGRMMAAIDPQTFEPFEEDILAIKEFIEFRNNVLAAMEVPSEFLDTYKSFDTPPSVNTSQPRITLEDFSPDQTEFVVFAEHTLAYHSPGSHDLGILQDSVLRGSPREGASFSGGQIPFRNTHGALRFATPQDFADFRVDITGYQNDDNYLIRETEPATPELEV